MNKPANSSAFPFPAHTYQNGEVDCGEDGMSLREYAAIHLRVPDSGSDWLDKMIEQNLCNHFAGLAMQGILMDEAIVRNSDTSTEWIAKIAAASYEIADAMLKARKVGAT